MNDELAYISVRLAKLGYYSGDPGKVLSAPANIVCDIIAIERVQSNIDQHMMSDARNRD